MPPWSPPQITKFHEAPCHRPPSSIVTTSSERSRQAVIKPFAALAAFEREHAAVESPPDHEVPRSAVPQTAEQHRHDELGTLAAGCDKTLRGPGCVRTRACRRGVPPRSRSSTKRRATDRRAASSRRARNARGRL